MNNSDRQDVKITHHNKSVNDAPFTWTSLSAASANSHWMRNWVVPKVITQDSYGLTSDSLSSSSSIWTCLSISSNEVGLISWNEIIPYQPPPRKLKTSMHDLEVLASRKNLQKNAPTFCWNARLATAIHRCSAGTVESSCRHVDRALRTLVSIVTDWLHSVVRRYAHSCMNMAAKTHLLLYYTVVK